MPAEMITKLTRMFQDIALSEDINRNFKHYLRSKLDDPVGNMADHLHLMVLNSTAWLSQTDNVLIVVPHELEDFFPAAEEFYRIQHRGRRLQWNYLFSHGVMQFSSLVGCYDLDVTTHQMVILYSWNDRANDKLSFDDLFLATGLPEVELKRSLWVTFYLHFIIGR